MGWPYEFLDLTTEEKAARRKSLHQHASIAHLSVYALVLIFILIYGIIYVARRIQRRRRRYHSVAGSPHIKFERLGPLGQLNSRWTKFMWWLGDDVNLFGRHWGQNDEWVLGVVWTLWLLSLCVRDTGNGELPPLCDLIIFRRTLLGRILY